jgi:hypothetical protein
MSCILNAVDADGTNYLLLDCTSLECCHINRLLGCTLAHTKDVLDLKIKLNKIKDNLSIFDGMAKRNLMQLLGLLELDFTVTLEYSYDSSNPTSDYRYPIILIKENEKDDFIELKVSEVSNYDEFMSWKLPKFLTNANCFIGSKNSLDYYIGKGVLNENYIYYIDSNGYQSNDLIFKIEE